MLSGSVIHGDGFGRQLGYPTANIPPTKAATYFRPGVYAASVTLGSEKYKAALAIHDKHSKIEVFLMDYEGPDFYGVYITIDPLQRLSEMEPYDSVDELKDKIASDVEMVREYFAQKK